MICPKQRSDFIDGTQLHIGNPFLFTWLGVEARNALPEALQGCAYPGEPLSSVSLCQKFSKL